MKIFLINLSIFIGSWYILITSGYDFLGQPLAIIQSFEIISSILLLPTLSLLIFGRNKSLIYIKNRLSGVILIICSLSWSLYVSSVWGYTGKLPFQGDIYFEDVIFGICIPIVALLSGYWAFRGDLENGASAD